MAKHSNNLGHCILFQNTTIFSANSRYKGWMIRDAIKIQLHSNNMNREKGLRHSPSQKLLIHSLKRHRKPLKQQCVPTWLLCQHSLLYWALTQPWRVPSFLFPLSSYIGDLLYCIFPFFILLLPSTLMSGDLSAGPPGDLIMVTSFMLSLLLVDPFHTILARL